MGKVLNAFSFSPTVQNHNSVIGVSLVMLDCTAALCPAPIWAQVSALVTIRVSLVLLHSNCREVLNRNRYSMAVIDVLAELTPCFQRQCEYKELLAMILTAFFHDQTL